MEQPEEPTQPLWREKAVTGVVREPQRLCGRVGARYVILATRWVFSPERGRTTAVQWSPSWRAPKRTEEGSRIGLVKRTSIRYASGRRGSSAASTRACVHIPWMIARGKPNALPPSAEVWIGLMSPDTDAYRRPRFAGSRHTASASISTSLGRCT